MQQPLCRRPICTVRESWSQNLTWNPTPPRIEEWPRSPPNPTSTAAALQSGCPQVLPTHVRTKLEPCPHSFVLRWEALPELAAGWDGRRWFHLPHRVGTPSLGPRVFFEPLCQSQWATVLPLPTLPTWAHMATCGHTWVHVGNLGICRHTQVHVGTLQYMWATWVSVGTPRYMRAHPGTWHTRVSAGTHGYMWAHLATCGHTGTCGQPEYLQAHPGTCGYVWVFAGTCGYMGAHLGICGHIQVHAGTRRYMWAHPGIRRHTWVHAGTPGYMWAYRDTCGHTGIHAGTLGYMGAHMGRAALAAAPCPSQAMTSALTLQVCQVQLECMPWQCVCAYCTSNVARNSSYYYPKAKHGFFFFR